MGLEILQILLFKNQEGDVASIKIQIYLWCSLWKELLLAFPMCIILGPILYSVQGKDSDVIPKASPIFALSSSRIFGIKF